MSGQVYIFERDNAAASGGATALSDALNAITIAARDSRDIRYEVLTDESNPRIAFVGQYFVTDVARVPCGDRDRVERVAQRSCSARRGGVVALENIDLT